MADDRWHALPAADVVRRLATDASAGLSPEEARARLARFGPNQLPEAEKPSPLSLFLRQFQDFMILVLLAAAGVSALLGEWLDAAAVAAIVVLNGVLGFVQEYRAERSLEALRDLTAPAARVLRAGRERVVAAEEVVPGDVVLLFEGDRVPADGRLLETQALAVDESVLTGESAPAAKNAAVVHRPETQPGDRKNMVFKGTAVARGRGTMVVTATGPHTEIGRIAGLMRALEQEPTPLQRRLAQLGRWLVAGCLGVVAAVFALGVLQGQPAYRMFLTAVSLAVAAIPEGLPAVVTIALALGVQQMLRRKAIVRRLSAVETLGCATVICADKTGTLTRNEMTATRLWTPRLDVEVTGEGYRAAGEFRADGKVVEPLADPDLALALRIGWLCNHARLQPAPGRAGEWTALGDPTEAALLVLAAKAGLGERPRDRVVAELPFDAYRKRMSVLVREGARTVVMTKGAPDLLVDRCTRVRRGGAEHPLTAGERRRIEVVVDEMTKQALRVLALAYAVRVGPPPAGELHPDEWERELVFVGLVGLMDPPRPEAKRALRVAERAGIRTIMVTGDHPHTAAAVARELGILAPGDPVATGAMLDQWSDEELARELGRVSVFARVAPHHKLRIVQALRRSGEVVAMTGDGVNDAPAVKEADIGVAMGRAGTDVTREAADMVLADDNYATIVAAVEEGRGIYDNIRKFIRYLLGCNVGEVLTMLCAALAGLPLPLLPMQILWMNFVTDGLPAIALGLDRPAADCMRRPPRPRGESVFAGGLHVQIVLRGVVIAACTLFVFLTALAGGAGEVRARTLAFTTLVVLQLVYVFQCRSGAAGAPNYYLLAAVAASLAMQLAVLHAPALQDVFGVVPLAGRDWLLVAWVTALYAAAGALAHRTWFAVRRRLALVRA
ncbi:MAG: cation-translocating P-type ATPase [Bacillota bacterium]